MVFADKFTNLRPAVKHGLLAGAVILMVKLVFVLSGNWSLRFAPYYPMLSFLPIYAALIIAGKSERSIYIENFKYWKALKSALLTILIVVAIGTMTEFVIYNVNRSICESSTTIMRAQMVEGFKFTGSFYSNKMKDEMIRSIDPSSFMNAFSQMFGYFFSNGILALIIALFTRQKPSKHDWLNEDSK